MPDLNVTIVLPSGGARTAEVPDDVTVKELMPEFTSLLELPTVGPDGRAMAYRLDSKALGRVLKEDETLQAAGVPENDRLMLTADITAGAGTSSITVTWLTTGSKTVTVNYNNANGCTAVNPGTYTVTLTASNNVSARSVSGSQVITVTQ